MPHTCTWSCRGGWLTGCGWRCRHVQAHAPGLPLYKRGRPPVVAGAGLGAALFFCMCVLACACCMSHVYWMLTEHKPECYTHGWRSLADHNVDLKSPCDSVCTHWLQQLALMHTCQHTLFSHAGILAYFNLTALWAACESR